MFYHDVAEYRRVNGRAAGATGAGVALAAGPEPQLLDVRRW
jgi:hypothetical protein